MPNSFEAPIFLPEEETLKPISPRRGRASLGWGLASSGLSALLLLNGFQTASAQSEDKIAEVKAMLGQSTTTQYLVQVWDDNQITIEFNSLPLDPYIPDGAFATRELGSSVIRISPDQKSDDVDTLTAIAAHELKHVADEKNGIYNQDDKKAACLQSEFNAFLAQALFWFDRFNVFGKKTFSSITDAYLNSLTHQILDRRCR